MADQLPEHWMTKPGLRPSRLKRVGGGLLLLGFGGVFLYFLLPELLRNIQASNWQTVACTIVESRVAEREGTDPEELRTLYRAEIRYTYELGGQRHESSRYRFANPYINDQSVAERIVRQFPAGAVVSCYVNASYPSESVLDRSISPYHFFIIIPLVLAVAGLWKLSAAIAQRE